MFFLLRAGLVIGLIFYLSPLRPSGGLDPEGLIASLIDAVLPAATTAPAGAAHPAASPVGAPQTAAEAERLWRNLPPEARQAVLDRLRAQAAASLRDAVAAVQPPRPAGGDTLRPDDRRPAWRGEGPKP